MYFNMPRYDKEFSPKPDREWFKNGENEYVCQAGNANLRVFRADKDRPWWAECDKPEFESKVWFWTPEQAQHWTEQELNSWFD